jgi:hypothetical protein
MNEQEYMPSSHQRPYFIWNADLTEQDVRQILAGDDEYDRTPGHSS